MAAREGISEAEAETRRWQELIYGVAVRLNTIPSIQLWPEGLSFPSGTSLKVAAAAGNVAESGRLGRAELLAKRPHGRLRRLSAELENFGEASGKPRGSLGEASGKPPTF